MNGTSGTSGKGVCLHNVADLRLKGQIPLPYGTYLGGLAYAPDGTRLIVGVVDVHVFRIADGEALSTYVNEPTVNGHAAPVKQMALSPDGKVLAIDYLALTGDGKNQLPERLRLIDAATGATLREIDLDGRHVSTDMVFSADSQSLRFAGSETLLDREGKRRIGFFSQRTIVQEVGVGVVTQKTIARDIHTMSPTALAISRDGRFAFTGTDTGAIHDTLDQGTGKWVHTENSDPIRMFAVSDGRLMQTFSPISGKVVSLMISASGETLVSCQFDVKTSQTVTVWDVRTRTARYSFATPGKSRGPSVCALSPDEKHLIYAAGNEVLLIDFH
ncbi:hypothetical protein PAQ31011_03649 [Pandoraea aquatica]|uniref:WD40 repeat domain-containing protein n=2 Tax=Pandoraea aquatica TaxID=2508290 RepID=A0A5E4X2Z4_9BURK|nr:hypothetical protein PAQ31011_03649 [Pandoraea aquatica]